LRTIEIKNSGTKPLIISDVKGSCSCTATDWTKSPILPNQKGFVKVNYQSSSVGKFHKSVTINSNDVKNPVSIINIVGEVN